MAATTSTEISPIVSQARMSTSVTLTTFLPPPKRTASLGKSAETGVGRTRAGGDQHDQRDGQADGCAEDRSAR